MDAFEVLNRGGAAKVEQILSDANVACTGPLTRSDVGERMLYGRTPAKCGATWAGLLQLTELPRRIPRGSVWHAISPLDDCCRERAW